MAGNTLRITAEVSSHANMYAKLTHQNSATIGQSVYLETNHEGLLISLSLNEFTPKPLWVELNNKLLDDNPILLSDELHLEPTKIGEIEIAQTEGLKSIGITVSVK